MVMVAPPGHSASWLQSRRADSSYLTVPVVCKCAKNSTAEPPFHSLAAPPLPSGSTRPFRMRKTPSSEP